MIAATDAKRETARLNKADWDFKGEETRHLTHGLHPYPARMVPQIARDLIQAYSSRGDLIYDPMCGSGTVLVEARVAGRNSLGLDINPLALLLAKSKSTPVDPVAFRRALDSLAREFPVAPASRRSTPEKGLSAESLGLGIDLDFWFKPTVVPHLLALREAIAGADADSEVQDLLRVVYSLTVRAVSNTRTEEFKLYRIDKEKLDKHAPDVRATFFRYAEQAFGRVREFFDKADRGVYSLAIRGDARTTSLNGTAALIVSSPPYGDSSTTVAYGQFSRLSAEWLGLKEIRSLDRLSLGGKTARKENGLRSPSLRSTLDQLAGEPGRAGDVKSFFLDLDDTIRMMQESLRPGGIASLVVGNRTVRGVPVPTDRIIAEIAPDNGLEHVGTLSRNISQKNMPLRNSPTNVAGKTEATMQREHIVVLRRE